MTWPLGFWLALAALVPWAWAVRLLDRYPTDTRRIAWLLGLAVGLDLAAVLVTLASLP